MAPRRLPPGITVRVGKDGVKSYRVRWRQGGRNGPQESHTFGRLDEAIDALARIRANGKVCACPEHSSQDGARPAVGLALRPGEHDASAGAPTFGRYAHEHVDTLTGVGTGYRVQFRRDLARHWIEFLDRPLDGITEKDVQRWIRGCEEGSHPWLLRRIPGTDTWEHAPLSATTIRRLLTQAGAVMAAAQQEGLIGGNPFKGHRLAKPKDRHDIMRLLSPEDWCLLESELPEGWARDLCRVLVGTGLRFGEATALQVGDVDLLATPPRLRVRRAWKQTGGGAPELGEPKSARSRRSVQLGPEVVDALAAHVVAKQVDELVFTAPRGGQILPGNFFHRMWKPAVERAMERGLSFRPRIHDLRHTHASFQLNAGVSIFVVSRRLGHESAQTTTGIYGHLAESAESEAVAAVEAAMTRGR